MHNANAADARAIGWSSAFLRDGEQEDWEDSAAGWPQTSALYWWRLHDEYELPKEPA